MKRTRAACVDASNLPNVLPLAIEVLQLVQLGSPHVVRRAVELAEIVREGDVVDRTKRRRA